ncbi:efflux transporter periplasmic adaptor subunit [Stenotrophomonas sp. YAU14A_MKIMI4_1]|nr:efflux transporter periplasmic adaptor subunit [Stenotrophomonas sp. YAU14A_MKIMI4_1]
MLKRATAIALFTGVAACTPTVPESPDKPAQVQVQTLMPEVAELRVALPGRAVATQEAEVRPQVDGIVARRLFEEGSLVREGQPLYQIDDARLQANRDDAEARLSYAYATCSAARQEARRLGELATLQVVSQQEKERAVAAYQRSEADIKMATASLQTARVALGHARIVAPISGRIGRSHVTEGALVTAHQADALTTVRGLDPMHVDLSQSSAEWLQLRRDITDGRLNDNREIGVTITLEDGSALEQSGTLQFSDVSVDPATGTYGLRVRVANPDGVLLPGMYVTAKIGAGERRNALLVPMKGVTRDTTGQTNVMVVDNEGLVEVRQVRLGRALGERWLVEDGLRAGDRIVVQGLHKLKAGMKVTPVEASKASAAISPSGRANRDQGV